jgi:hypothetical protein
MGILLISLSGCGTIGKSELQSAYDSIAAAWTDGNIEGLHNKLAADAIINWYGGDVFTKDEWIRTQNRLNDILVVKKYIITDVKLLTKGDFPTATATASYEMYDTINDVDIKGEDSIDTSFEKVDNRWMIKTIRYDDDKGKGLSRY